MERTEYVPLKSVTDVCYNFNSFLYNCIVSSTYNSAASAINYSAEILYVSYHKGLGMGGGQMLDDVDHMSRRLWRYWKQAVTTPISGSDVVDSFTTLENYETPATFLATGGAATIKSAASVGKVLTKPQKLIASRPPKNMSAAQKGVYGEHVSDVYMANQGHTKLNGPLTKVGDAPKGKGIDGIWKNSSPPPDYIITETKYGSGKLGKTKDGKQMSDKWIDKRLDNAIGKREADKIRLSKLNGSVQKQMIKVDDNGAVTSIILK